MKSVMVALAVSMHILAGCAVNYPISSGIFFSHDGGILTLSSDGSASLEEVQNPEVEFHFGKWFAHDGLVTIEVVGGEAEFDVYFSEGRRVLRLRNGERIPRVTSTWNIEDQYSEKLNSPSRPSR